MMGFAEESKRQGGVANAPARSSLKSMLDELDPYLQRLGLLVDHLNRMADGISGGIPQEVKSDQAPAPADHLHAHLNVRRSNLSRLTQDLEDAAVRLERSLF